MDVGFAAIGQLARNTACLLTSVKDIETIPVASTTRADPLLSEVATVRSASTPGELDCQNGLWMIGLSANLGRSDLGRAASDIIKTDLQRTFVIRIQQRKAQWVDVKTGVTVNGKTEVFGDLQSGDIVVRNATDSTRAGTSVEVQGK